jgi:predicted anti-sigma-YlaC factor YlaD
MSAEAKQISCDEKLIAAYIDGELESANRILVEHHLEVCNDCRAELQAHRLFVCELDSVLTRSDLAVPPDFSRVVAARATSDMSGIRSASENKKALLFCLMLAITALGLLSDTSRVAALKTIRQAMKTLSGTISVLWTAFYDMVASVTVISRVISRKLIVESDSVGLLLVLFALAILLLSRMIVSYHRTGATE